MQFLQTNEAAKHIPVCNIGFRQPDRLPADHGGALSFKQAASLMTRRLVAQAFLCILTVFVTYLSDLGTDYHRIYSP